MFLDVPIERFIYAKRLLYDLSVLIKSEIHARHYKFFDWKIYGRLRAAHELQWELADDVFQRRSAANVHTKTLKCVSASGEFLQLHQWLIGLFFLL